MKIIHLLLILILFFNVFTMKLLSQEITLEDMKILFEKYNDKGAIRRFKEDPKVYEEHLQHLYDGCGDRGATFCRIRYEGMFGKIPIGRWGIFLLKAYSEDDFNEMIRWRNHKDDRLRSVVWGIIWAYVENKTTPDEVVKNKIKPLLAEKKRDPDSVKWVREEVDSAILAEQVRFMDKNEAFNLLSSKILNEKEVNKFYPMKLLSLLETKEAVDFIEKNLNRVGNDIYFLEIAKMNYELSSCKEPFETYKKYFTDEKCHFATRIYALWHLFKCDNIKRLEVVYNVYKSEKKDLDLYNAGKGPALSEQEKYGKGELWEAIKSVLDRFEQDSSLHDEIKRLSWPK